MERHRHVIALVAFVASFLWLATTPALGQDDRAGDSKPHITAGIDFSRVPVLEIDARGISSDELLASLARELGFDVKRIGRPDPSVVIRGRFIGELEDLLPSLLRHED